MIDTKRLALRLAHRIRAIAIQEGLVPVGKPDPDSPKRTGGELRKSIHVSSWGGGAVVGTNKAYARAVHEGRRAMIIRPKRAKMLRWAKGGKAVFARKVFQPRREGRPFFRAAVDLFERDLDKEVMRLGLEDEAAQVLAKSLRRHGVKVRG